MAKPLPSIGKKVETTENEVNRKGFIGWMACRLGSVYCSNGWIFDNDSKIFLSKCFI